MPPRNKFSSIERNNMTVKGKYLLEGTILTKFSHAAEIKLATRLFCMCTYLYPDSVSSFPRFPDTDADIA